MKSIQTTFEMCLFKNIQFLYPLLKYYKMRPICSPESKLCLHIEGDTLTEADILKPLQKYRQLQSEKYCVLFR